MSRWGLGPWGQGVLLSLHPRLSVGGRVSRWVSQHCPRTLVPSTLPPKTHRKYLNTPHLRYSCLTPSSSSEGTLMSVVRRVVVFPYVFCLCHFLAFAASPASPGSRG